MKLQVEQVDIATLRPWDRNPRAHKEDVDALVRSIQEYGWTNPILVQKGTNRVIAGHGRLEAAKKAGLKQVPVIALDLDDRKANAYTIADNKLAENSEWDKFKLKELLVDLDTGDFDLELTGYNEDELKELIDWEKPGGLTDPDAVPEAPAEAFTKPGDLWLMGEHRLLCGDSTANSDVSAVMGSKAAHMMWTDPPYGVSYVGKTKDALEIKNDDAAGLEALLTGAFQVADDMLMKGAPIYIARPAGALSVTFGVTILATGWHIHEELQWVKDSMVLGHSDYHLQHETVVYGWKQGKQRPWYGDRNKVSIFTIPRPKASPDHPTGKPVELVETHLQNSSQPGDIVYEPFMGSGTTLIAAEKLSRKCYGLEIEPRYCDVIVKRWQQFTGKKAELVRDGKTQQHPL